LREPYSIIFSIVLVFGSGTVLKTLLQLGKLVRNDDKLDAPGSENVGEEEGETPVVIQPPHVDGAFPLHILNNHNEVKIDNQCGGSGMFISDPTFIHP
jgi:hypothetical protein